MPVVSTPANVFGVFSSRYVKSGMTIYRRASTPRRGTSSRGPEPIMSSARPDGHAFIPELAQAPVDDLQIFCQNINYSRLADYILNHGSRHQKFPVDEYSNHLSPRPRFMLNAGGERKWVKRDHSQPQGAFFRRRIFWPGRKSGGYGRLMSHRPGYFQSLPHPRVCVLRPERA